MARRRKGFFAELNRQAQIAERERRQRQAAVSRAQQAARREAERTQREYERQQVALSKADERARAAAEKAAKLAYQESRVSEVAAMNADLAEVYAEIDGLLAWTLEVDDFVDLESLRPGKPQHPPFETPAALASPIEPLPEPVYPPEPIYAEPKARTGLFASAKRHEAAVARARAEYEAAHAHWYAHVTQLGAAHAAESARRAAAEAERQRKLAELRAQYDAECQQREEEAQQADEDLTALINDLAFDVEAAIEEYVGIVLSNSVYPDAFPVATEHAFDLASRELTMHVTVPGPSDVPAVKAYKYVKATDTIAETGLPVKDRKERYASAVWQTAVRTLHEVFEADRAGKVHSIALTVSTQVISAATGLPESVPLVVVAAARETFLEFDLANVVPHATLTHLGAALSRSPLELVPAAAGRGVRVTGR